MAEQFAKAWEGFVAGDWQSEVNVRDFIQKNYTPYEGDESFLVSEGTEATKSLWSAVMEGIKKKTRLTLRLILILQSFLLSLHTMRDTSIKIWKQSLAYKLKHL